MSTLSILIKEKATELGFHKVGIARADAIEKDKQNLEEWIRRKQHASMDWVEKRKDERGDVFKYFGVYDDPIFTDTKQFSSGRLHIAKKCNNALKIYSQWWKTAKERPDLFFDSPSLATNLSGFIENRHDQSIWSVICKKFSIIEKKDLDLFPIEPSRIWE